MAQSSSIFSSDGALPSVPPGVRPGIPIAFLGSLALIGVVEIGVRCIPPSSLIAYIDGGVPKREAVKHHVQTIASPPLVFVGSSRVQSAILCPVVAERISASSAARIEVANFASGGALVQELEPLVTYMLDHPPLPSLIAVGMGVEQIAGDEMHSELSAMFWDTAGWRRARERFGSEVDRYLPDIAINFLADHYLTFRYRRRPLHFLVDLFGGHRGSSIRGEIEKRHTGTRGERSLVTDPPDEAMILQRVRNRMGPDGSFAFNDQKQQMWIDLAKRCRASGVEVVFFELRSSAAFNRHLPPGLDSGFQERMRVITSESGFPYFSLEDLGLVFTDDEFRDPVHLNRAGAERFSRALADKLVGPFAQGRE